MRFRRSECLVIGICVALLGACVKPKSRAKISHFSGEPAANMPSFFWRESSDEEFFAKVKKMEASNFFLDSHPFAQRVNFWVERIDALLRKQSPTLLEGVPVPRAKIQRSGEANANMASTEVCIPVRVAIDDGGVGEEPVAYVDRLGFFGRNVFGCVEQRGISPEKAAQEFVKWYNGTFSTCRLVAVGDVVRVPKKCANGELSELGGARKISFLAAVNVMTVQSSLPMVFPNENEFVAVIAHELAHYYRAHGVSSLEKYGYFYLQEKDMSLPEMPVREEKFAELGRRIVKLSDFSFAQSIPDLHYRSEMLPALRGKLMSELTRICHSKTTCATSCGSLVSFLKSRQTTLALGGFPETDLSSAGVEAVKEYDRLLFECAKTVNYKEFGFEGLLSRALPPSFLSKFEERSIAPRTLDEELRQISLRIDQFDSEFAKVIQEANEQRLGYYTTEQEADEFAVDWIAAIGIDPVESVRQMMTLGEFVSSRRATKRDELPFAECKAQYLRGWKTESGANSWIPVGRWNDKHHSLCYRAWNLQREIAGHRFSRCLSCGSVENRPGGDWASLLKQLSE